MQNSVETKYCQFFTSVENETRTIPVCNLIDTKAVGICNY